LVTCPACGYIRNIEGADLCDRCQSPLVHLSKPRSASAIDRAFHKDRIRRLSPGTPLVAAPGDKVAAVLRQLVERSVGCVVVVEGERVVGIFSERDALLRLGVDAAEFADRPISEFMTAAPETLELDDNIAFAVHKMDLHGFRHIPITEDGRIAGVISARDILRYVTEELGTASA